MSMSETKEGAGLGWAAANRQYLQAELVRLRLLLHRRVLRLRKVWKRDLASEFRNFQGLVITDAEADLLLNSCAADADSRFDEHDDEAQGISRGISEQQLRIGEAAQAVFATGGLPALEILARLFRLGPFERDVLLLCLAPEIDANFERLFAYVQDDAARKYPTPGLAVQLFSCAAASEDGWVHFAPDAPLRRFRLVHTEAIPGAGCRNEVLRLDRRIGSYLLGVNFLDEQSAVFLRPVEDPGPLGPDQEQIVQRLERRLRAWKDRDRTPGMNLTGTAGVGSMAVARQLCARIGVSLYALDPFRLPASAAERQACYRLLERESLLLPCAYYIDCTELDHANRADAAQVLELMQGVRAFLFAASREPLSSERPLITIRVQKSNPRAQLAVWKTHLGGPEAGPNAEPANGATNTFLTKLIEQFHFSPQQIHRVVRSAREAAALRNPEAPALTEDDLWIAARGQAVRLIEGLAEKIEPKRSLEELVLPQEPLQQIREIASQVEQRGRVYEQWGFGAKLSRGRGIAALFAGPSGTGKTMAAEVLARHLELDLYRIDLAGVISKYIGETEKNLKRVFDAAEESGAILFFDEADALFGKRSEVRDSHDRYANIEINYLLQRMEDYRGLAILATNKKSLLDQAFLRRLRFLVDFPFPSAADRVRIWRGAFPPEAELEPLDYEYLGRLEIAGGNISNIALNAAFLAAGEGVPIHMHHILTAARREYDKIDKLVLESEFGRYYTAVQR